ncbi:MAG: hypothetical protein N2510_03360 [Ignavibacteria bacterium]|nr:hypothetical protein [Ignavibacteria bacterium]
MKSVLIILLFSLFYVSCSDTPVSVNNDNIIFSKAGLLDSAVVYGCYAYTVRHFVPDSFDLQSYSHIKIQFNGFCNSDGSSVTVYYNTGETQNVNIYAANNQDGINKLHSFSFPSPKSLTWFEIRLYINPPVCGKGEFKYVSVRDLKITGLK